jgi:predicted nucleic acid-binding protein
VNAEGVYVDPSALCRLYLNQPGIRELTAWRRRATGALPVTHHGRGEVTNAICLAAFRGELSEAGLEEVLAEFEAEFAEGRLHQADLLWRAALNRAAELSRTHTPRLGTRAADVLHVACALELKLKHFLTFDERQQKLAVACGLKPVKL